MTAPLPTPGEVEGMRERHGVCEKAGCDSCHECGAPWPCDAEKLRALVEAQEARLAAVLAALPARDWVLAAQASDGGYARQFVLLADRIRRAASGEGT